MKPTTIRTSMLAVVWLVALTSAILSYSGIRELALEAGFGPFLSWLLPLSIDGLVLAGALVVLDAETKRSSKKFGWTLTITGVLASVAANVAVVEGLVPMLAHSAPPIILALTLEAWLHTMREDVRTTHRELEAEKEAAAREAKAAAKQAQEAAKVTAPPRTRKTADRPTPTAEEVLKLKAEGLTHQAIADQLGTSKSTVTRLVATAEALSEPAGPDPTWP